MCLLPVVKSLIPSRCRKCRESHKTTRSSDRTNAKPNNGIIKTALVDPTPTEGQTPPPADSVPSEQPLSPESPPRTDGQIMDTSGTTPPQPPPAIPYPNSSNTAQPLDPLGTQATNLEHPPTSGLLNPQEPTTAYLKDITPSLFVNPVPPITPQPPSSLRPLQTHAHNQEQLRVSGMLSHSYGATITNAVLNNIEQFVQVQVSDHKRLGIALLGQRWVPGAEPDSFTRSPPPECLPETRKELKAKITAWLSDANRDWNMFWLLGPAGVGKSAVARAIAKQWKTDGHHVAAFFFSRLNNCDDPSSVIPTLVYQFVVQNHGYKDLVTERLADDFSILYKDMRSQFQELILKPFRTLSDQGSIRHPLLVILDGLDECDGREVQRDFIQLISEHARSGAKLPLLWMICSRPEWHLIQMLSDATFGIGCCRNDLVIDSREARDDVHLFLRYKFDIIRRQLAGVSAGEWPADSHVQHLSRAASGFFSLASAILDFIEDKKCGTPMSQLDISLKAIGPSPVPGVNPFRTLDRIYKQILDDVSPPFLPNLMRILCLRIHCPGPELSVAKMLEILYLDQATFYVALEEMYSVLRIPTPERADKDGIHFYHVSFETFLTDETRSGDFSMARNKSHCEFVMSRLRQYNALKSSARGESASDANGPILLSSSTGNIEESTARSSAQPSEEDIIELLQTRILRNRRYYKSLLNLEGAGAQHILNLFQKLLGSPAVDDVVRRSILIAMLRLSMSSGLYPQQLRLHNVKCDDLPMKAGQSADIFRGRYQGHPICIKIFRIHEPSQNDHFEKLFTREAIVWSQLRHPNVLPFYGIYHLDDGHGRVGLVSPWVENGNLLEYLKTNPGSSRLSLSHDIVTGLVYLHQRQVVHGNLKGLNILINDDGSACLADFGLSAVMDTDVLALTSFKTMTRDGGSARWMAPEIMDAGDTGLIRPTCASDIYSLGSVLFEVFTGKVPYYEYRSEATVIKNLIKGIKPARPKQEVAPDLTDSIWAIMEGCWSDTPSDRPTVSKVLECLQETMPVSSEVRFADADLGNPVDAQNDTLLDSEIAYLMNVFTRIQ